MKVIPDDIDFSAYIRQTEASVKVRRASEFEADLQGIFGPAGKRSPAMLSKLGHVIEYRPAEVTCWAGYSGHRKSMLSGQVALDLCVQRQRVLIASMEMLPASTLARMARQASGTEQPDEGWLRAFAKWTDDRLWIFDHMGRISPTLCLAVCKYFADELKGQHVFIDSFMMVCATEENMDEQKQFATDIVRCAQETGLHIHIIAHCRKPQSGDEKPPSKYDIRGSSAITDQAHNVILVWSNKPKREKLQESPWDESAQNEPDAKITVAKQRNGAGEGAVKMWFHDPSMRFLDDRTSPVKPYRLDPL